MISSSIPRLPLFSIALSNANFFHNTNCSFPFAATNSGTLAPKITPKLRLQAQNGGNGLNRDPPEAQPRKQGRSVDEEADTKKDQPPIFNLQWGDLLSPDPDNIVAVGLTGLLTWASVQVLWQLFFISIAIIVAALKYSFIAALLIFILITLL